MDPEDFGGAVGHHRPNSFLEQEVNLIMTEIIESFMIPL